MSKQSVRDAFDGSVACTRPPVRRQSSQESTVPKASSPRSASERAPGTSSSERAFSSSFCMHFLISTCSWIFLSCSVGR